MELLHVENENRADGTQRINGLVRYLDGQEETYWFELPAQYDATESGNPWVACLLPLAVTLGEDLVMHRPVDPELLRGAEGLVRIWKGWYPHLSAVSVTADVGVLDSCPSDSASFFSSGVDSFFTVLRFPHVKNWLTVLGFDMPVRSRLVFERHCRRLDQVAAAHDSKLIRVVTNLRDTRWRKAQWEGLAFGPALACVGLLFEKHFHTVLVPSSCDYSTLYPWGSHPLSDPLFSTSLTRIIHEGIAYGRFEKTKYIAQSDLALRHLHVCFRGHDQNGQDDSNCCRCEKCYRTMITLDLLGVLDRCELFDRSKFLRSKIAKIFCGTEIDARFFIELQAEAVKRGRQDIAGQIGKALRRSRRINWLQSLSRLPLIWRLGRFLKDRALRDSPR